jgi:L-lactate utilization protein LutB
MDERDLTGEKKWHYACLAERAILNLRRNRFEAVFAADCDEAREIILEMIAEGSIVGSADSVTLDQIGIFDHIQERNPAEVLRPMLHDEEGNLVLSLEELVAMQRKVLTLDVYICGANAVTLDGKLVNTDGVGNRVAPMIFGPQRTIIVVGANKIVPDVEAARERIRRICAPINVRRHIEKHNLHGIYDDLPCARTGFCADCRHPMRICATTVVLECAGKYTFIGMEKKVVIIGEELGI